MSSLKRTGLAALVLAASLAGAAAPAAGTEPRSEISGSDLRIFTAALDGMAANGHALDAPLEGYRLSLAEEGDAYVVSFSDPHRPAGIRGSSPIMPEFAVQLRKGDLSFIRWIGVR